MKKTFRTSVLALAVAALATSLSAQTLTPGEIDQALGAKSDPLVLRDSGKLFGNALAAGFSGPGRNTASMSTGFSLRVYTPQTWIAYRAAEAKRFYKPFTAADLTPADLAPVLHVLVFPDEPESISGKDMASAQSVAHVVMRDEAKTAVVQPILIEPFQQQVSSALRDKAYAGVTATFDLAAVDALRQKNKEFLIVVVGEHGEKAFKVKTKHFENLPYHLPTVVAGGN